MNGLCKDCKHWEWQHGGERWSWGECVLTKGHFAYPEHKGTTAVADARGMAVLVTRPDFGCNQFEAKP